MKNTFTGLELINILQENKLEGVMINTDYSLDEAITFEVKLGTGYECLDEILYEFYCKKHDFVIRLFQYESDNDGDLTPKVFYISKEEALELRGLA